MMGDKLDAMPMLGKKNTDLVIQRLRVARWKNWCASLLRLAGLAMLAALGGNAAQSVIGLGGWLLGFAILGAGGIKDLRALQAVLGHWQQGWSTAVAGTPLRSIEAEVESVYEIVGSNLARYGWLAKVPGLWLLLEDAVEACAVMRTEDKLARQRLRLIFWGSEGQWFLMAVDWLEKEIESVAIITKLPASASAGRSVGRVAVLDEQLVETFLSAEVERGSETVWRSKGHGVASLWKLLDGLGEH